VLLTALALGVFLFARVAVNAHAPAPSYDLLITNARIVDGSGNPWFRADVAIKDGRIEHIVRVGPETATRSIDARGQSREIYGERPFLYAAEKLADFSRRGSDKPHQFPLGISYVIVNGAAVIDNSQLTTARPGVALRGPGRAAS
jgi:urease alpha subunit